MVRPYWKRRFVRDKRNIAPIYPAFVRGCQTPEDVVFYLQQGALLDDIEHPNGDKYPGQRVFVINIDGYVHLVPYVESRKEIFLKTVIPSRKATKQYLGVKS